MCHPFAVRTVMCGKSAHRVRPTKTGRRVVMEMAVDGAEDTPKSAPTNLVAI